VSRRRLLIYNLLFLFILISIIIFHYQRHYSDLKRKIVVLITKQAESVARRVEVAANIAFESTQFVNKIIRDNLISHAKFLDLLNSIEPFTSQELDEYTLETNINLIAIRSIDKKIVSSNMGKFKQEDIEALFNNFDRATVKFQEMDQSYLLFYSGQYSSGSDIIIGFDGREYTQNIKKISVETLLENIKKRGAVIDAVLKNGVADGGVRLVEDKFFEVKVPVMGDSQRFLELRIDAKNALRIIDNFRHNLIVFISVILSSGLFGIILIYILQNFYLSKIKVYEKKLFDNEKDAALGRSAAMVAHEIRNPINAVSMGIQRIKYETDISKIDEYSQLIETIDNELKKINSVVNNFLDFTKPVKADKKDIKIRELIDNILLPYRNSLSVDVSVLISEELIIPCDKILVEHIFGNLIKNVFENEKATYLKIYYEKNFNQKLIIFENDGIEKDAATDNFFEPYFTTKSKGAGLGLAIVKKFVDAHNWEISIDNSRKNIIKFMISI